MSLFLNNVNVNIFLFLNLNDVVNSIITCEDGRNLLDTRVFYMYYWNYTLKLKPYKNIKRDYKLDIIKYTFKNHINKLIVWRFHNSTLPVEMEINNRISFALKILERSQSAYRDKINRLKNELDSHMKFYNRKICEINRQYTEKFRESERYHNITLRTQIESLNIFKKLRGFNRFSVIDTLNRYKKNLNKKPTIQNRTKIRGIDRITSKYKKLFVEKK